MLRGLGFDLNKLPIANYQLPLKRADAAEARSALGTGPQFILELAWA